MVTGVSEVWYSSSTFERAFSWYPWCQNQTSGTFLKKFFEEPDSLILILISMTLVTLVTKNTNFRDFGLGTLKMVLK